MYVFKFSICSWPLQQPHARPKTEYNDPARISRRVTTLRLMHFLWHKQFVVVDSKLDTLEENLNRVKRELEIPEEKEQVRPIFSVCEALRSIGSVRRFANCWFIDTRWLLNAHFFYCSYLITHRKYFVCFFVAFVVLCFFCLVVVFWSACQIAKSLRHLKFSCLQKGEAELRYQWVLFMPLFVTYKRLTLLKLLLFLLLNFFRETLFNY